MWTPPATTMTSLMTHQCLIWTSWRLAKEFLKVAARATKNKGLGITNTLCSYFGESSQKHLLS